MDNSSMFGWVTTQGQYNLSTSVPIQNTTLTIPSLTGGPFVLGKDHINYGGWHVQEPGKPLLVDAEGRVLGTFETVEKALAEAKRIARKNDDDIYLYVAKTRIGPTEPKVEEVAL